MTFSRMMESMQYSLDGKILFVNAGAFYIARGKDAILVNKLIGLKLNCLGKEVCKVGFPINAVEKYSKLLEEKQYSFIIYKFNEKTELLEVVKDYNGIYKNEIKNNCLNCQMCKAGAYSQENKYARAFEKLKEKDNKNEQ